MQLKDYFHNKKILLILFGCLLLVGLWFGLFSGPDRTSLAGEQVISLADNVRNFYKNKPNAWGLNTYSAIQNKIIPQDMLNGRQIKNSLGKDVLLGADMLGNTVMPGSKTFAIVYKNLNKQECKALASLTFSEKFMLSIDEIIIINDTSSTFSWGSANSLPISSQNANDVCKQTNDILWNIYL